MAKTKSYSFQEACLHRSKDDCWIVIDSKVYDVTSYLDEHPGGDYTILEATGKDAKEDFEEAGHSKSAIELMENYYIGTIDVLPLSFTHKVYCLSKSFLQVPKSRWFVPTAILGASIIILHVYTSKRSLGT